jgi:uncharacterized protein YndB with AHSA1/START domain
MMTTFLTFEQTIAAPSDAVLYAFTNATALREWLCDIATVDPRVGGRFYVAWNQGHYVSGEYTDIEPNRRAAFSWRGRGEATESQVQVMLAPQDGNTHVTLTHSGLDEGETKAQLAKGWQQHLANLKSVLETGEDLRLTLRPLFGLSGGVEVTPELAAQFNLPVTSGLRLDGVIDGIAAHKAGLQKDDVLVTLAGQPIHTFQSLGSVLQQYRAGDRVEAVWYRGQVKHTATLELSKRPIPPIPLTGKELADAVSKIYAEGDSTLAHVFANVNDEVASRQPMPGEWSAKEVLAHFIINERFTQTFIYELLEGQERWSDRFPNNNPVPIAALVAAHPTVSDLLAALQRAEIETTAMLAALPDALIARKGSYWRLAYGALQGSFHFRDHLNQIKAALQA